MSSPIEFYVNIFDGLTLMVITGELNEKLKEAIGKIKKAVHEPKKKIFETEILDQSLTPPKITPSNKKRRKFNP